MKGLSWTGRRLGQRQEDVVRSKPESKPRCQFKNEGWREVHAAKTIWITELRHWCDLNTGWLKEQWGAAAVIKQVWDMELMRRWGREMSELTHHSMKNQGRVWQVHEGPGLYLPFLYHISYLSLSVIVWTVMLDFFLLATQIALN